MPLIWWLFGLVAVIGFYNGAPSIIRSWENLTEKRFLKKLFWTAFAIRAVYVVIMYLLYTALTGSPFEFGVGDAAFYNSISQFGADCLLDGKFNLQEQFLSQDAQRHQ